jgi:hypothetical protein
MFLQMAFDTENTALSEVDHVIKNASLRLIVGFYEILSGFPIHIGIFGNHKATHPILNVQYRVDKDSEACKKRFSEQVINGIGFLDSIYSYLLTIPKFAKVKIVQDV